MNSLLAVFRFELRRILTPGRAIWWLLVAGFPILITILMRLYVEPPPASAARQNDQAWDQVQQRYQKALEENLATQQQLYNEGRITWQQLEEAREVTRRLRRQQRRPHFRRANLTAEQRSSIYTFVIYFLPAIVANPVVDDGIVVLCEPRNPIPQQTVCSAGTSDRATREHAREQCSESSAHSMNANSIERIVVAEFVLHCRAAEVAEDTGDEPHHHSTGW